jgi:hypothetical protein
MRGIRLLAFGVAIGFGTMSSAVAAISYAQGAYAAAKTERSERTKAVGDCTKQANQRKLGATSIRRRNFLMQCMRRRGFSGPP